MASRFLVVLSMAFLCAACTIDKSVKPVTNEQFSLLCIRNNQDVLMDDFQSELVSQIKARGIPVLVYTDTLPASCSHRLLYSASWSFTMSMYLSYLSIVVYRDGGDERVGEVIYDASGAKAMYRFDKLGPTASKLNHLLDELFPQGSTASASN